MTGREKGESIKVEDVRMIQASTFSISWWRYFLELLPKVYIYSSILKVTSVSQVHQNSNYVWLLLNHCLNCVALDSYLT